MEDLHFSEIIARAGLKAFNNLPKTGKPNSNQWTVLSCIVQENNSCCEVVALGTGSKCIGTNKMSPVGDILNDSHSEVICRRAFLLYLYEQMENALLKKESIFFFCQKSLKFKSNDNVKYHFFSTMMPCGDASIFPKCDDNNAGDVVGIEKCDLKDDRSVNSYEPLCKTMKGNDGDIYRTGAKCLESEEKKDPRGEGAAYHITGVVRTKPGRGDPTLSVSCSDKMTKWCYLGLQGALMSIYLEEPIYLSTLTIVGNTPFCTESLERAFYGRIVNLKLFPPYEGKKMIFQQAKDSIFHFQKSDQKEVCPSSIIWYKDAKKSEVAVEGRKQGITKKTKHLESSRLKICKAELFKRFKSLYQHVNSNIDSLNYRQYKEIAKEYQLNWNVLKYYLGKWPEKPNILLELNQ
ncbi:tRNA-specific adenosine deaminase 1 [Harmonia axyridis]|uniref:tRNA-specific adenosine deaminase 1 n=1 Tax=Harmonia axyridis TaxID=115357 RepID=UPI001E2758BD|nr:tRNA-specific adenosine deaminase 1 [Harmonia axyridis]